MHPVIRTFTGNFCSAINGTAVQRNSPIQKQLLFESQQVFVYEFVRGRSCRGLLLEEKPELKRVLEQRRLELHREEEMAQRRPSDLETELRKRQQKLEEVRVNQPAAVRDISVKFSVKLRYRHQYSACLGYDTDTVQIYRQLFRLQVGLDPTSPSVGLHCGFLFFSTSKRRSGSGRTSRRSQSLCVWRTTWGEHRHLNNEASITIAGPFLGSSAEIMHTHNHHSLETSEVVRVCFLRSGWTCLFCIYNDVRIWTQHKCWGCFWFSFVCLCFIIYSSTCFF